MVVVVVVVVGVTWEVLCENQSRNIVRGCRWGPYITILSDWI